MIPVRLAIAHYQAPNPQAILTLGGGIDREIFTAEFAQAHPTLEIWVSSGADSERALSAFRDAGISAQRVHLDRRATDTVTNFTSLVADFKRLKIQHLYLITSDFHIPRAKAIATLVLGSRGIAFTPVSAPSKRLPESRWRILRDIIRSLVWIMTAHASLSNHYPLALID
ncbi:MAG: YdcF family protein [Cyanothece sp. SIO1E1]|nr:YdcF family protein [Cyanothece sp. SIO1E1]